MARKESGSGCSASGGRYAQSTMAMKMWWCCCWWCFGIIICNILFSSFRTSVRSFVPTSIVDRSIDDGKERVRFRLDNVSICKQLYRCVRVTECVNSRMDGSINHPPIQVWGIDAYTRRNLELTILESTSKWTTRRNKRKKRRKKKRKREAGDGGKENATGPQAVVSADAFLARFVRPTSQSQLTA